MTMKKRERSYSSRRRRRPCCDLGLGRKVGLTEFVTALVERRYVFRGDRTNAVRISVSGDVAWGKGRKSELANGDGVRCRWLLFFSMRFFLGRERLGSELVTFLMMIV